MSDRLREEYPKELAREAIARLKELADEGAARQALRFFKQADDILVLGVKTPQVRTLEKALFARVRGVWSTEEALDACNILISQAYHEPKVLGLLLITRFHKAYEKKHLGVFRGWIEEGHLKNWAAIDALSMYAMPKLIARFPDLIPKLYQWTSSPNLWIRRTAAVSFVGFARHGEHLDTAYEIAIRLLHDTEDLIHKAVGWLLREAGKTDSARLEQFLLQCGGNIPRTTLRYAIEKFPEEKRKKLLTETS